MPTALPMVDWAEPLAVKNWFFGGGWMRSQQVATLQGMVDGSDSCYRGRVDAAATGCDPTRGIAAESGLGVVFFQVSGDFFKICLGWIFYVSVLA